jgi:hypothetical protein
MPRGRSTTGYDTRVNIRKITRGACLTVPGPCPHRMCRYHAAQPEGSAAGERNPPPPDVEMCSLRLAKLGGMTLEDIGRRMSISRERVRQIEERAMRGLIGGLRARGVEIGPLEIEALRHLIGTRERSELNRDANPGGADESELV